MKRNLRLLLVLVVPLIAFLAGCGGGMWVDTVSGVVAAGAPFVGTVDLKDASIPAKVQTATINPDGSFSFDVGDLTPPFILKATGVVGTINYCSPLYSFANGAGTANINPLTNLAVAIASGGLDPATVYASPSAGIFKVIAANLSVSVSDIQSRLQPLLALYDSAKTNPFSDTFIANHTGLDEVLDMVAVDVTGGNITITNRFSGGVIVSGQSSDPDKWISDSTQIPPPQIHPVINPVAATLKVNETVVFKSDVMRSSNKKVTWSVVETAGGTITAAGVYTAPAVEGTYHVMASSDIAAWPVTATVKVIPASTLSMSVTIDPSSTTVTANGSKTFTATVTGSSNTKVTWSVAEQNGGSITSTGVYTAPATAGTYHVKAVSVADPSKSATATVKVSNASTGPFPIGTWVGPHNITITVNALVTKLGTDNFYSGSVKYPAFSGGIVTVSGGILSGINYVQNNALAVSVLSSGTVFTFSGDSSIDMKPPITSLSGDLIIVSSKPGYSYDERATFVKK